MARTAIPVTQVDRTGTIEVPAQTTTVTEHKIENNGGRILLEVENAEATPTTITFLIPQLQDGVAAEHGGKEVTVANAKKVLFGPFPVGIYNQAEGAVFFNTAKPLKVRAYQI